MITIQKEFFMTPELIKRMIDACYLGKRARELLPPLPAGVLMQAPAEAVELTSRYIQILNFIIRKTIALLS